MKNAQYTTTKLVSTSDDSVFSRMKPGQWIATDMQQRGQFLGITDSGAIVIRWQRQKFTKRDAVNNKHLRRFARTYGSK